MYMYAIADHCCDARYTDSASTVYFGEDINECLGIGFCCCRKQQALHKISAVRKRHSLASSVSPLFGLIMNAGVVGAESSKVPSLHIPPLGPARRSTDCKSRFHVDHVVDAH